MTDLERRIPDIKAAYELIDKNLNSVAESLTKLNIGESCTMGGITITKVSDDDHGCDGCVCWDSSLEHCCFRKYVPNFLKICPGSVFKRTDDLLGG